ncbi:MAG: hypothetical protein AB8B85_12475 [Paracoccaceae bacterium]
MLNRGTTKGTTGLATGILFAAMMAGTAFADHPGALWSVDRLDVRSDGATAAQVSDARMALAKANETYFYGDRGVRMDAIVAATGAVRLDVIDAASGDVLVEGARFEGGPEFSGSALAWMDGLDCAGGRCGEAGQTLLAAVQDSPIAPAKAMSVAKPETGTQPQKVSWPTRVTGVVADVEPQTRTANIPAPRPRPGATDIADLSGLPDLEGLRSVAISRNPVPNTSIPPIRISRFDTRALGPISYSADDRMVVGEPRTLAPATQALPSPGKDPASRSLIGRWVDGVASFFGITDTPARQARPQNTALASAPNVEVSTYAPAGTPLRANQRWKTLPTPQSTTRLAALDQTQVGGRSQLPVPQSARPLAETSVPTSTAAPSLRLGGQATPQSVRPAATAVPSATTRASQTSAALTAPRTTPAGIRLFPSPGLGLPSRAADPLSGPEVTPIRVTAAAPAPRRAANKDLAVKLHPEVFGKYSSASAERLFGSYGRPNAPVRLVTAEGGSGASVDRILSKRGLALDSGKYAKAERVFWSGRSGSRGFWISMPQVAPSSFVLVASAKASVIANVYPRGSAVQVSDSVAKALGLKPGQWSDVQIVALRQLDRTASRSAETVLQ